jgi:hypothetical protein
VTRLDAFKPDAVQASYTRAILPGATARFGVRFWNLEQGELQRLLWCLTLESGLAHKLGHHRYVGFGSVRMRLLPESTLIDWQERYAGEANWRVPIKIEEWLEPKVVAHRDELRQAMDAQALSK